MRKRTKAAVKPYYRLSELVELTDSSRGRVKRLLRKAGIEPRWVGGLRLVFLSDLEANMPDLCRSLILCERARAMARALGDEASASGASRLRG
jgi:hypothetical protein